MLLQAAAAQWNVPVTQLRTENSNVINIATNAKLTYGALAAAAAKVPVPANPTLKTAAQFKLIGTSPKRLDTVSKVNGTAGFGMDFKMPGMLYAAIERCPVFEGKVKTFDGTKAKAMPGVKEIFSIGHGVAVVATNSLGRTASEESCRDHLGRRPARGQFHSGLTQDVRRPRGDSRTIRAEQRKR